MSSLAGKAAAAKARQNGTPPVSAHIVPSEQPKAPPAADSVKYSLEGLVKDWAQTLNKGNAPDPKLCSHLAWVRAVKVPELIEILTKAGYRP